MDMAIGWGGESFLAKLSGEVGVASAGEGGGVAL